MKTDGLPPIERKPQNGVGREAFQWRLLLLTGSLFFFSSGPVGAQAQPPEERAFPSRETRVLEEIVVTARKREESLQRVPVAVTALDGSLMRYNLASDLSRLGELAPQVSMQQGGSGTGALITIRGVSTGSTDAGLDQSVAVEIDGVPISRGQVISTSLFDVQQVQILQGPQALFFGKNSPAGVISLHSADPTDELERYVTAGYEFEADERYLEAAVSGPLTDTLKARLAFRGRQMEGWMRNDAEPVTDFIDPSVTNPGATHGSRLPDDRSYAGRLSLLWTPTDDFDAALKLTRNLQKRNAGNANSEPFCKGGTTQPVLLGSVPIPQQDCRMNQRTAHGAVAPEYAVNFPNGNGGKPYFRSDFNLASLTLNWRLEELALTSTTGYYDQTVRQMSVSDWSPFASIWAASEETYQLMTQELRANTEFAGPVNFMGGLYYEQFDRDFFNAADLFHSFNNEAQNFTSANMDSEFRGEYYSAFAQVRWYIVPDLELAAGARYSRDEKRGRIRNFDNNFPGLLPEGQVLRPRYSDDDVSPEVTLSWYLAPEQTLYAAYKTGYKAGGISNPFLVFVTATPENLQFEPEETRGGELGYKASLLDERLRFDLVAYRYRYEDLQVVSFNAETISFAIGNAASARIEGVQGSFEWLALHDLTLRGNFGYNRARYRSFPNAQCFPGQTAAQGCVNGVQDLEGEPLLRAPELTFSLGADYSPILVPGWATTLSVQGTHSDAYETAGDYSPGGLQEAYWLLNAALRVGPDDGRYELALIGRNLTDSYYRQNTIGWSGSGNPNQFVGFFNRPREVALQVTTRF